MEQQKQVRTILVLVLKMMKMKNNDGNQDSNEFQTLLEETMKITQEEFDTKTLGGNCQPFNVVRSNVYLFKFKTIVSI